jgi:hypothetical protein
VRSGDTLFQIAQRIGSTVGDLQAGNCLMDPNLIIRGDVLFLPIPGAVGVPTPPAIEYYGCTAPEIAFISSIRPGEVLQGEVNIEGTASTVENFRVYRVEIRADNSAIFMRLAESFEPVVNGPLARLDVERFREGLYWLRLSVVETGGNLPDANTCMLPVYLLPEPDDDSAE